MFKSAGAINVELGSGVSATNGSAAFGFSTVASGDYSATFGRSSEATGDYAVAFGKSTLAGGAYSVAFGLSTDAVGNYSTAFGRNTIASNSYSLASGYYSIASGLYSASFGAYSTAVGDYSCAFGRKGNAAHSGSTVFADSQNSIFDSATNDSFNVRAQGGVFLETSGSGLSVDGTNLSVAVSTVAADLQALETNTYTKAQADALLDGKVDIQTNTFNRTVYEHEYGFQYTSSGVKTNLSASNTNTLNLGVDSWSFFGDSNTDSLWVRDRYWESFAENIGALAVNNYGYAGDTASNALDRLSGNLPADPTNTYDVAFAMFGANDAGMDYADAINYMEQFYSALWDNYDKVILISYPHYYSSGDTYVNLSEWVKNYAATSFYDYGYIDFSTYTYGTNNFVGSPDYCDETLYCIGTTMTNHNGSAGGLHFNQAAHDIFSRQMTGYVLDGMPECRDVPDGRFQDLVVLGDQTVAGNSTVTGTNTAGALSVGSGSLTVDGSGNLSTSGTITGSITDSTQITPPAELQAYVRFDDLENSASVAYDPANGFSNVITNLVSVGYDADFRSVAAVFTDGVTNYIELANTVQCSDTVTIGFLMKGSGSGQKVVFGDTTTTEYMTVGMKTSGGTGSYVEWRDTGAAREYHVYYSPSGSLWNDGDVHSYVVTISNSTVGFYVDGSPASLQTSSGAGTSSINECSISRIGYNKESVYGDDGSAGGLVVDEFFITTNKAWSAGEAAAWSRSILRGDNLIRGLR